MYGTGQYTHRILLRKSEKLKPTSLTKLQQPTLTNGRDIQPVPRKIKTGESMAGMSQNDLHPKATEMTEFWLENSGGWSVVLKHPPVGSFKEFTTLFLYLSIKVPLPRSFHQDKTKQNLHIRLDAIPQPNS